MVLTITKSTTEVISTTCEIFADGVNMGHTNGPITVTVNRNANDITVNQFGPNVLVASNSLGTGATIEIPFAQFSAEIMSNLIPEAVTVSGNSVYVGDTTGTNFLDNAVFLEVAPRDGSDQFTFPAAIFDQEFSVPFDLTEQTTIVATARAVPDPNDATASGSVLRVEPNGRF